MAESSNDITYYYFDLFARGETPRMILHYHGVDFKDERFSFERWGEWKKDNASSLPFGQLPCLEYKGKRIAQSNCIARFLCQLYGYYPKDLFEQADVEQVREFINLDINEDFNKSWFIQDSSQKEEYLNAFFKTRLPEKLALLNKWIKKNGSNGFVIGNSITLVDFILLDLGERILFHPHWAERAKTALEGLEDLKDYFKKRHEDPKWQEYIKKRVFPAIPM